MSLTIELFLVFLAVLTLIVFALLLTLFLATLVDQACDWLDRL